MIHSLVDQLLQRSPYLQHPDEGEDMDPAALLNRSEINLGKMLGSGNFSNAYEVIGLDLENQAVASPLSVRTDEDKENENYTGNGMSSIEGQQRIKLATKLFDHGKCLYAVKCLRPELLDNSNPKAFLDAATDLVIEAKYLCKLDHCNILKVRGLAKGWEGAFADGQYDSFFILTDRLEETLNQRIKRWKKGEFPGENTLERKLPIALQVASAISYLADRNLLFRDLKPQNIGIVYESSLEDTPLVVKLFDFGFCRELPSVVDQEQQDMADIGLSSRSSTLMSGETVFMMSGKGTRRYMATEVLLRNQYNLKCDVYSWAMVCWELLTLHKPFYQYTKEQHAFFVCEGGDRPPLESPTAPFWPPSGLRSLSVSVTSAQSVVPMRGGDNIDFQKVMTDPLRDLLKEAWHQDVSQRLTMREVHNKLQFIIQSNDAATEERPGGLASRTYLHNSCLTRVGGMRNKVVELAEDIKGLPIMACFGHGILKENDDVRLVEQATCNPDLHYKAEGIQFKKGQEDVSEESSHGQRNLFGGAFPNFSQPSPLMAQ